MKAIKSFEFDAEDKSFEDILFSSTSIKYRIPKYQRPYAWEEDQILDYWNDICDLSDFYFIGSFVFNKESFHDDGYIDVIDGQQRLLTTTIFMTVLRDLSKDIDPKLSDRINRFCIALEDKKGNISYRILCGDSTKDYFEKYIQHENGQKIIDSSPSSKEHKRIKSAYLLLEEKVKIELSARSSLEQKSHKIQELWDRVSKIKVISITINSEDEAYEIFETVNARGVELSVADLLKNLIFKKMSQNDESKEAARDKWNQIEENIKETGIEISKFFRYHWISKYSFVTEKKLFKEIKSNVTNYNDFLDELLISSGWFNKIIEGNIEDWQEALPKDGSKIYKNLRGIKVMNVTQCYVIFMSILRNYSKFNTNPRKVFELIEKFSFIYSAVCKQPTNKLEKIYSKYALKIESTLSKEADKNTTKILQALICDLEKDLDSIKPTKEEFEARFNSICYDNKERTRLLIKYILNKINEKMTTGEYLIDFSNVNIEHLLPQNPSKEWGLKKADIKPYVNKLGNLTLLSKIINSKIGNKPMKDKIKLLNDSDMHMTKSLVTQIEENSYVWSVHEINVRQEALARQAYTEIWKI